VHRLLALALTCLGLPALADAVDLSITRTVKKGQLPSVQVQIQEPIAGFRLNLTRSDGKTLEFKGGGRPGTVRTLSLEQPEGHFGWSGTLTVNFPNASVGELPLTFETDVVGPLKLELDVKRDVDFAHRRITFKLTRPAGKAELMVLMDTGERAFDGEVPFAKEAAGTPLEVTWPEAKGQVMRVELKVYDVDGFFQGVEVTQWEVDIPHEEVTFDSGKAFVRADQVAKLEASYGLIADAVTKYGRLADIKLYLAGHTDTVGPTAANRTLSLARAKAIAQYFRKRGLTLPLFYEGFGEEALAVPTADEVDEARNRRAEYIIAIEAPAPRNTAVVPQWHRL
jgi:outer membrane protein OmpA-like peptidoglycan-associated protein